MKLKFDVFLLLLLTLTLSTNSDAATDTPEKNAFSFQFSGDLHGGISSDDKTSSTFYPVGLRLQSSLEYRQDLALLARIKTVKAFESNSSDDDNFMVDRLFLRWRNILVEPFSITVGRLATTANNAPIHFRMGLDRPEAELLAFTDIILDGAALAYEFRQEKWREILTLYAASQYDYGYEDSYDAILEGSEIYGIHLATDNKGDDSILFQFFAFKDIYSIPAYVSFINPLEFSIYNNNQLEFSFGNQGSFLDRTNLGDIYHTSLAYQTKRRSLNYFLALGWSRTDAKRIDELGSGLLTSWWEEPKDKDGYSFYTGIRYDFKDSRFKLGLEFNYGSKNWIAFTAPDEFYTSKLTTRGYAGEIYTIYDIPVANFTTALQKGLIRLGYQYLHYEYTGSGYWLGEPYDIDELRKDDPLSVQFYKPAEYDQRLYLAIDLYF